jgi:hypothetical protein
MAVNNSSKFFDFPNTILKTSTDGYEPWDVIIEMLTPTTYNYRVLASSVNFKVPSNHLAVGTGSTSAPKYLGLYCTASAGRIIGVEIQASASPFDSPTVLESVPPSSFYIPIGVIGTDGNWFKMVEGAPLTVIPYTVYETDRNPPVLGLAQRIKWLSWRLD